MAEWTDIAEWHGVRFAQLDPREVKYITLHIEEIPIGSAITCCTDNAFHFFISRDGRIGQSYDTDHIRWGEDVGDAKAISVGFEGQSGDTLTLDQINAAGKILARAHEIYEVPLALTDDPTDGAGLGYHAMGGESWGDHPECPGPRIVAQRPDIIAAAIVERGSQLVPAWPGYLIGRGATGSNVRTIQQLLSDFGFELAEDEIEQGLFGETTANAVARFQSGRGQVVDETVGTDTWLAMWTRPYNPGEITRTEITA
jgi:Putative peptidoglycan binding domain/N-acetylmuramoyl-L-alanine amidase